MANKYDMRPYYHWWNFYQGIRDESWPDCVNEHEFQDLHPLIRHEILKKFHGQSYLTIADQDITMYGEDTDFRALLDPCQMPDDYDGDIVLDQTFRISRDFSVLYNQGLDGQGSLLCQFFPRILAWLYPGRRYADCLDWCSGAGFIGFRLLSDGLINNITMMDKHQPALTACRETWSRRPPRLDTAGFDTVHGSSIGVLDHRRFDLIVANPPNFDDNTYTPQQTRHRLSQDPNWNCHNDFFANVARYLNPQGVILLVKNIQGSQPRDHVELIKASGLEIRRVFTYAQQEQEYYIEIGHAD